VSGHKRLLLVGWDSTDWKLLHPLMDSGATPAAAHLVNHGSCGNLTTLEPQLSPMLWTSIATGKMAYHHGVPGFTEVHPASGRAIPVSAATRWPTLRCSGCFPGEPYPLKNWPVYSADGPGIGDFQRPTEEVFQLSNGTQNGIWKSQFARKANKMKCFSPKAIASKKINRNTPTQFKSNLLE
jgi:hypothetical protein